MRLNNSLVKVLAGLGGYLGFPRELLLNLVD